MNTGWTVERRRVLGTLLVAVGLGLLTGNWLVSLLLSLVGLLIWMLWQLRQLHGWVRDGYPKNAVPDNTGAWGEITSTLLRSRNLDKRRRKRLSRMLKAYRDTVMALPDAVVVVNQQLEIEWANKPAEMLLGIKARADVGRRITNLVRLPEFVRYLDGFAENPIEIEAPTTEGRTILVQTIRYGQDLRLILARDISERVQVRNALQAFVSNASHELKTPITVTSGHIDMMLSEPDMPEQFKESIQQLREQTDRMSQLIRDLLTLSRLEGTRLDMYEGKVINVPAMLAQIVQDLQATRVGDGHRIDLNADENLGLTGIESDISSIGMNLIENAIKYTPDGRRVQIKWAIDDNGSACLEVKDNGPGIKSTHLPNLTRRFYRAPASENTGAEGTGLGLAIVKHAVRRHGGELKIDSALGKGTSIEVRFPSVRVVKLNVVDISPHLRSAQA